MVQGRMPALGGGVIWNGIHFETLAISVPPCGTGMTARGGDSVLQMTPVPSATRGSVAQLFPVMI